MGLDAGSREVLLDLIYRLSLDDKASDGKARAPGDGAAKERHRKERSGDDEDDEARRLRARRAAPFMVTGTRGCQRSFQRVLTLNVSRGLKM